MPVLIRTIALLSALGAVACGATTSSYPPTANRPSTTVPSGPVEVSSGIRGQIPAGQELDVQAPDVAEFATARPEQRFEATTAVDMKQNGRVLIPAGSSVRGVVSAVKKAGRVDRTGSLTLSFDQLIANGREQRIRATATHVFESRGIRDETGTAGIGAGAGAVIGGIVGGIKGAIVGAVIGAGGAIAATEGSDIELPAGSIIRIRLDSPVTVN